MDNSTKSQKIMLLLININEYIYNINTLNNINSFLLCHLVKDACGYFLQNLPDPRPYR
ncbi:hypothetical protein MNV_40039 [Candidatus Methanoperedens nitroreducens]|uniref:Uncharacterized protein n=1 Tax=Candidatus Methanoperedens nitratireducens TaxID=1392998 RepID=A0A284VQK8_9EURY|nr:hypothetical protein MNV_40039 [Candidatus Methanoperedens nitroreducens]